MLNRTSPKDYSASAGLSLEGPVVLIVDDDAAVREGLNELILSAGMAPVCFASTRELLDSGALERPGCLILDVRMPGASGLDLQHQLSASGNPKPIIFLTGHGDIPMTVQAMKAGAVDFLTKPVDEIDLLKAIHVALERDQIARDERDVIADLRRRLAALTPREGEVLRHVAAGRLNKQIAADLGTSLKTIKVHRHRVMTKMAVRSVAELVRVVERLGIGGAESFAGGPPGAPESDSGAPTTAGA